MLKRTLAALVAAAAFLIPTAAPAVAATASQENFSNWYVMTYRCPQAANEILGGGWSPFICDGFTGSDNFGNLVSTHFNVHLVGTGITAACTVTTSWWGQFHEYSKSCYYLT